MEVDQESGGHGMTIGGNHRKKMIWVCLFCGDAQRWLNGSCWVPFKSHEKGGSNKERQTHMPNERGKRSACSKPGTDGNMLVNPHMALKQGNRGGSQTRSVGR